MTSFLITAVPFFSLAASTLAGTTMEHRHDVSVCLESNGFFLLQLYRARMKGKRHWSEIEG